MRELLLQDTQELFESELKKKKEDYEFNPAWSSEFSKYFDKNIMPDIENLAKYSIKETGFLFLMILPVLLLTKQKA